MFNQSLRTLFVCLVAVTVAHAESTEWDRRIVGGQKIEISKAPYLMQLRDAKGHFCGGTLVEPRYVVTAAHCLEDISLSTVSVVGGASTVYQPGVKRKVVAAFVPKPYTRALKHMDIAVLKLDSDMEGKDIQTIPLAEREIQEGDQLQVSGWGKLAEEGPYPDDLRTVSVPAVSRDLCARNHVGVASITSSMSCAFVPGVKDACSGDSGGPAIRNNKLAGVVSWGIGCGRKAYPGVYSDIYNCKDFLDYALAQ